MDLYVIAGIVTILGTILGFVAISLYWKYRDAHTVCPYNGVSYVNPNTGQHYCFYPQYNSTGIEDKFDKLDLVGGLTQCENAMGCAGMIKRPNAVYLKPRFSNYSDWTKDTTYAVTTDGTYIKPSQVGKF